MLEKVLGHSSSLRQALASRGPSSDGYPLVASRVGAPFTYDSYHYFGFIVTHAIIEGHTTYSSFHYHDSNHQGYTVGCFTYYSYFFGFNLIQGIIEGHTTCSSLYYYGFYNQGYIGGDGIGAPFTYYSYHFLGFNFIQGIIEGHTTTHSSHYYDFNHQGYIVGSFTYYSYHFFGFNLIQGSSEGHATSLFGVRQQSHLQLQPRARALP